MVFIPFMGAYVSHAGTLSAWQSAFVALAGPAAGLAAAVVLYVAAVVVGGDAAPKQGQDKVRGRLGLAARGFRDEDGEGDGGGGGRRVGQLLHALCDFGCMINLFNLLPLGSLDGGQVAATLHPSLLVIGCVFGTAIVYQGEVKNPLIYLILLGGYYQVAARALGWELPRPGMVHLSPRGKAVVAAAYVGIAGALAGLMALNQARLYGPKGEAPGVATGEDSPYAAEFDRLVEELPDI
jgi:Zn-dependent protease